MAPINPLCLPEIWFHISIYLKDSDVVRCLCVCKASYRLILPHIWAEVLVDNITVPGQSKGPPPDYLRRHCLLVRKLEINSNTLGNYNFIFPNLHTLALGSDSQTGCEISSIGDVRSLVSLNSSLVHLRLHRLDGYLVAGFWKAVADLPHLRSLHILGATMTNKSDIEPFWSLCTKLESIHIAATKIATCDSKLANLLFPNTRSLELRLLGCDGNLDQFDLIRLFPRLEELKCYSSLGDRSLGKFGQAIAQGLWPSLEKLSLGYGATDENLSSILEGMQRITSLDLSDCHFGPHSFQALHRHFSTLVELSFRECSGVQGEVFQKIMCLSPHLEILKCNKIPANDVVNGEQWVCLSLKTLQVCFRFGRGDQYLQHLVFERLATLVHLECLDIGNYSFYQENPILKPLDLRLRSGFGALSSLTNIKFLSFYGTEQALEAGEALWMLENWKNLQTVSGELNRDGALKNTLVGIFQACGVRVRE